MSLKVPMKHNNLHFVSSAAIDRQNPGLFYPDRLASLYLKLLPPESQGKQAPDLVAIFSFSAEMITLILFTVAGSRYPFD